MNLEASWYGRAHVWLLPLSWLYHALIRLRGALYAAGLLHRVTLPVPVVVVGNVTVGGTGKTPVVAWLVRELVRAGWRPGIVSRGYGRRGRGPVRVRPDSDPAECGDEPLLLARVTGAPVCVAIDRAVAAQRLLDEEGVDVVVADDGLQHLKLGRDFEIAVVDASRGLGNGHLLPAGPLREPASRLDTVDLVLANGGPWRDAVQFQLAATHAVQLVGGGSCPLGSFSGMRVHAVAGIANPGRFFDALRAHGIEPVEHAFADHHVFRRGDLDFDDDAPVLMTDKDAVKCESFADARAWRVPVEAAMDPAVFARISTHLRPATDGD